MPFPRRTALAATILIATGAALRLWSALRLPLEQDEIYTIDEATNLFHTRLLPGIQARPVFFVLEHPFVSGGAPGVLALRALALVFGIAGLWALWRLARAVLGDTGALAALALVVLSPWHLYASSFARYYSLVFLLAALAYWLIPRAYDSDRPRHYLAALAPTLVGAWTHPSFIFPVAGAVLGVHLVRQDGRIGWRWPSRRAWGWLWSPLLIVSAAGLAAIRLLHKTSAVANGGERGLLATLRLVPAMVDWTTPIVAAAGVIGIVLLMRSPVPARRRFGAMALLGVAGSIVALFALSFVTAIYADYGIAALPLILVAGAGVVQWLAELAPAARQRAAGVVTATLVLIGVLPSAASYLSDGTRFDYRPAFAAIARQDPGTAVLAWPVALQRFYAPGLRSYELPTRAPELDSLLARERTLWAVVSVKRYGIVGDDSGEMAGWLAAHCRQVAQYQRPRFDYRMYRVDLWRCAATSSALAWSPSR